MKEGRKEGEKERGQEGRKTCLLTLHPCGSSPTVDTGSARLAFCFMSRRGTVLGGGWSQSSSIVIPFIRAAEMGDMLSGSSP